MILTFDAMFDGIHNALQCWTVPELSRSADNPDITISTCS